MFGKKKSNEEIELAESLDQSDEVIQVSFSESSSEGRTEIPPEDLVEAPQVEAPTDMAERLEVLTAPVITKPSILSQGFEFEGTLKSSGALIISGRIVGNISAGVITIEEEGIVDGHIKADALTVKGNVLGEIYCRELTVGPNAHVAADSHFDTIEVQRGGKISGMLNKS